MLIRIVALALCASGPVLAMIDVTPPPPKIPVVAPTPQTIKDEVRRERRNQEVATMAAQAARLMLRFGCVDTTLARVVAESALREDLRVRLVVAVLRVESGCRHDDHIVSDKAAVGPMQVNCLYWHDFSRDELRRNAELNVAYGTWILGQFVHRFGVREGLHRYNGLGSPASAYADHVLRVSGLAA